MGTLLPLSLHIIALIYYHMRYCFKYWESRQLEIHSDQTANRTPKPWLGLGNPSNKKNKRLKFVEFEVKLPQYFDQASLILGMSQTEFPPKCIGFLQKNWPFLFLRAIALEGKRFPLLKDGLPVGGKGGVPHPAMVGYR